MVQTGTGALRWMWMVKGLNVHEDVWEEKERCGG